VLTVYFSVATGYNNKEG